MTKISDVVKDDAALKVVLQKMSEFDSRFVDYMIGGDNFNIRLEVRGVGGRLVHARLSTDVTAIPEQKIITSAIDSVQDDRR